MSFNFPNTLVKAKQIRARLKKKVTSRTLWYRKTKEESSAWKQPRYLSSFDKHAL